MGARRLSVSRPQRVLLHVFPTFAVGGAQMRFVALANSFGPAYRHIVIALDGDDSCRGRLHAGVDAAFPSVPAIKGDPIGAARQARRVLRDLRPDLLITSNWGSIDWAIGNGAIGNGAIGNGAMGDFGRIAPHLHMEDGFGPEERARQLPRRVWTRRLMLRRSRVILPSRTLLRLATETWRLPPSRLHYVPNGVDLARFAPDPARRARSPAGGVVIGTVAALRPEKNVARLLRAVGQVIASPPELPAPARLVVVGDGPERPRLEQLARDLGIAGAVTFLGQTDDPAPFYRDFDLFALSSDTEQMPLSVLGGDGLGTAGRGDRCR